MRIKPIIFTSLALSVILVGLAGMAEAGRTFIYSGETGHSLGISNSEAVALGDVDKDGYPDAFVGNVGQVNKVWINDKSGKFTDSGQSLGTAADSLSVAVILEDIDADGFVDAVVANKAGKANTVWLNAAGTFSQKDQDAVTPGDQGFGSSNSEGLALGDLDGDGDLDAFVANYNQANKVWLNDGSGVFTDTGQNLGSAFSKGVALGDIDGDGDLDAMVANELPSAGTSANQVWTNDGSGSFSPGQKVGNALSMDVALGDIDNDGDLDAYVCNFPLANKVWLNTFGTFADSGQSLGSAKSRAVNLVDIDNDGDLDAYVANDGQPNKVWVNDGTGVFTDNGLGYATADSYAIAFGDVDLDGDQDVFVANTSGQVNKVWLNSPGTFARKGQSIGNALSYGVDLGDLDGDGDLDAFVANNGLNAVWLNADGAATFTATTQTSFFATTSMAVSLGDLDGDKDLDAFVANNGANTVWLNDGAGIYAATVQAGFVVLASTSVALGDLDGDGDLDAFVANQSGQANRVWLNDGAGIFTDSTQNLGSSNSTDVALTDLDADGDLDAFVTNNGSNNSVWLNDGKGVYTVTIQAAFTATPSTAVALGDLNGDGRPDAFVTNTGQANTVWMNDGAGTFTEQDQDAATGGIQGLGSYASEDVALYDLDGDGALDAFVANSSATGNRLWINDGTGVFPDNGQILGDANSMGVALGNLNGAGFADAFVTNMSPNTVWINEYTVADRLYYYGSGGGGCFIATAAYGTEMAPHVALLKRFRDNYLLTHKPGRIFVEMYYRFSPPAAGFISEHDSMRSVVRAMLLPLVALSYIALHFGIESISSTFIVLLCGVFVARRRRAQAH